MIVFRSFAIVREEPGERSCMFDFKLIRRYLLWKRPPCVHTDHLQNSKQEQGGEYSGCRCWRRLYW